MEMDLNTYDFIAPRKIVFGWGRREEIGTLARSLGRRAMLVVGSRTLQRQGTIGELESLLQAADVDVVATEMQTREPEVEDVDRVARRARELKLHAEDVLIAIGGGAAIDLAKAVGAMATQTGSDTVKDYLEGVGCGLTLEAAPIPVLAVPTTAGAGTEATKNAVISCYDPPFKKSLRDERILPQIALVDPELTVSTPRETTVNSGMDAITQLIESYVSCRAKPIPRALAEHALKLAIPAIVEAVEEPSTRPAREAMAHASLLSGMCLANAGLGMAHGVAPALGVHCRVPHGQACALMLPVALRANMAVSLTDFARLARVAFGVNDDTPDDAAARRFVEGIEAICDRIGSPRTLSEIGVGSSMIPDLVKSSRGNSMRGNPREVSDEELTKLLEEIA